MDKGGMENPAGLLKRIGDRCVAVYVTANPADLSEEWYMVGDANLENIALKAVHRVIPKDEFDLEYEELHTAYGEVQIIGETYPTSPYLLGGKRLCQRERHYIMVMTETLFYRANYLTMLEKRYQQKGNPLDWECLEQIRFLDTDYNAFIDPMKQQMRQNLMAELTEPQAREKAQAFLMLDAKEEACVQQNIITNISDNVMSLKGVIPMLGR